MDSSPVVPSSKHTSRSLIERYWWLWLITILIFGAALRTRGLNWDEDQHLHPDERFLTMVATAIRIPNAVSQYFDTATSPLSPYNNNFASFVYGTAPLFVVRLVSELVKQTAYGQIALIGRLLSALADVFVAAMTFAVGRRLYGLRAGLLATLLYAAAVLPIQQSHFFTVDTFANVPLMLAFWFSLDIASGRRGGWAFVLAGACFGLMLASRINLAPFMGIIALAALLRLANERPKMQRKILQANAMSATRTFESALPSAALDNAGAAATTTRTIRVGPLLIEIEFEADVPLAQGTIAAEPQRAESRISMWTSVRRVAVGLALAAMAVTIAFRIAQPYAFTGVFAPNPKFLDDLASVQRLVSGQDDYPPGHQWTNRLPYWFPWYNLVVWGLGPALGLAAWSGVALAAIQVLRQWQWRHLLMLFWVAGMFLYHGGQFVMTMRYFLPLYPFLAIFGAWFLTTLWGWGNTLAHSAERARFAVPLKLFAASVFVVVIGYTLFWASAFTSIYTRPNTRVAASRWLYAELSDTDVVGVEHWDDALPLRVDGRDYFRDHKGVQLELYAEDTPEKRDKMTAWMDGVDDVILSSNRLHGSIPRLPMRYPLTTQYFDWLFNGQLGFKPSEEFTSYPQFLGIVIRDDNAEEAFTVYDHPKVIIFQKTAAYSRDHTVALFDSVDLSDVIRLKPLEATLSRRQFQMDPVAFAANRANGTWSEIFDPNDWANRFPVLIWLVMVWVIGLLTFPITFVVFRAFADRGYAFAKALGILGAAWFAWTLSSYHILPFDRLTILSGFVLMLAVGALIVRQYGQEMRAHVKQHLSLFFIEEAIFLICFAFVLAIRYGNPDLWHPSFGGEKPMDLAFLNAISKTTFFPPYNPWFAGSYINYYYFGQLISATLVRLSGIVPEVAYNLLIPLFFALSASGAYGVVANVVISARRRSSPEAEAQQMRRDDLRLPSVAGLFAAMLVLLIGNLGQVDVLVKGLSALGGGSGALAILGGLNAWLVGGASPPIAIGDWYWTATRVIPSTINEFPFFTFLYADLHAHLIAIPYTLVALGLAGHVIVSRAQLRWYDLGAIALVLGALRAINAWDYPTYLGIIGAAMALGLCNEWKDLQHQAEPVQGEWFQRWLLSVVLVSIQIVVFVIPMSILGIPVTLDMGIYVGLLLFAVVLGLSLTGPHWDPYQLARTLGWRVLALMILSALFFAPFILNYATAYSSVELWQGGRTTLSEYLTVHGIFLFMVATFIIMVVVTQSLRQHAAHRPAFALSGVATYLMPLLGVVEIELIISQLWVPALIYPLVATGTWISLRRETPIEARWTAVLMTLGLLLTLTVEVITLKGDVGRMNTVFKFYLQAWVILGVACATGLAFIVEHLGIQNFRSARQALPLAGAVVADASAPGLGIATKRFPLHSLSRIVRWAWCGALLLFICAGLLYTLTAAWAKVNDRYVKDSPPGLNGMEYMRAATYRENNRTLSLREDYDAINWMRQNIKGSPVIAEANTGLYRWGDRYSIYTGLPTIIGWDWHTKQQYSLLDGELIDRRVRLVRDLYNTPDPNKAMEIVRHYKVSYVIVGGVERAVYDQIGLNKFPVMAQSGMWLKLYDANNVQIYQVSPK